jgi:lipoyl(octanoyl) transferase
MNQSHEASTTLEVLPARADGAAGNMALDFLMLQRYPSDGVPRFRHYTWHRPAFTFGYSQKIAFVREQLAGIVEPDSGRVDVCRRPTGGGIVDHRHDWTYALVLPRGHPLEELRATESYRAVHEALARALQIQGVPCVTKSARDEGGSDATEGVCFERAEIYDVVDSRTGTKIAGAAQKRNKRGLLFQGSIWRPAAGGDAIDWDEFQSAFVNNLGAASHSTPQQVPWPDFNEDEVVALTEQYTSPEWMEFR